MSILNPTASPVKGATRLSRHRDRREKSDPDADGNVTYTVTCAARARMDYTVAEGVRAVFAPAWTCAYWN